jgi:selenocysteine lyase/cysteine desulfurase
MVYANHAGTSHPKPGVVLEAAAAALASPPDAWASLYDEAHAAVARALGAADHGDLWVTSGCTAALGAAFTAIPFAPGDRVLTSGLEHHALMRWPQALAMSAGVSFATSPYAPERPLDLGWLERELGRGGVRLVALSMASNVTGEVLPVAEAARLARAHGALTLVDAAQAAGVLDLDVATLGADVLTFAGHKGPQGPQGVGGLWLAPGLELLVPAAACDAGAGACGASLSFCDLGSVNVAGLAGLAAGFGYLGGFASSTAERQRARTSQLVEAVRSHPRLRLLGGEGAARVPTVAAAHADPAAAERALRAAGVVARGGFHCAPFAHEALGCADTGSLRLSLGPGTTDEDVAQIVRALEGL